MSERDRDDGLIPKRFSKNDDGFTCLHCGKEVPPLRYTSRNHCPYCLWSIHVDINPGDRANPCRGALRPVRTEPDPKKGFVVIHRCQSCGELRRNKAAADDNRSLLIRLTVAER